METEHNVGAKILKRLLRGVPLMGKGQIRD